MESDEADIQDCDYRYETVRMCSREVLPLHSFVTIAIVYSRYTGGGGVLTKFWFSCSLSLEQPSCVTPMYTDFTSPV